MVSLVLMTVLGLILSQSIRGLAILYYSSITEAQLRRDGIAALDKLISELTSSPTNVVVKLNQYNGTSIQFPLPIKWAEDNPSTYWKGWPGWSDSTQADLGTWKFQYGPSDQEIRYTVDDKERLLRIQPAPAWPPDPSEIPYNPDHTKVICQNVSEFSIWRTADDPNQVGPENEFGFRLTLQKIIPFLKTNVKVALASKGLSRNDEEIRPFDPSDYPCDNDCQCESGEDYSNCPNDCPPDPGLCGNGVKNSGETHCNCCKDVDANEQLNSHCGDHKCQGESTNINQRCGRENFATCCRDCEPDLTDAVNGADTHCCHQINEYCDTCTNECSCLLSGTPVAMSDNSLKPIEEITVGDIVFSFDEKTQQFKQAKVTQTFVHDADKYLLVNDHLRITPNHPVLSNGKWVEIGTLKIGDKLSDREGRAAVIKTIKTFNENVKVFNIEVDSYHSYVAAGYVMHNKECGAPPIPPSRPAPGWCVPGGGYYIPPGDGR